MGAVRPVVTISAAYGAGGGFVGPRVAERLGVTFLDRAIPASVAADLAEAPEEVLAVEDDLGRGISHWLSFFAPAGAAWAGIPAPDSGWSYDEASYKEHVAVVLHRGRPWRGDPRARRGNRPSETSRGAPCPS